MCFREQDNWSAPERVMYRIMRENAFPSVYEAYQHVSGMLSLDMSRPDFREVAEAVSKAQRRDSLLETLIGYFIWNRGNSTSAKASRMRSYLKDTRGLDVCGCRRFSLRFVPDWNSVVRCMTINKGFTMKELDEVCGVRNTEGYTTVGKTHVLAIPYRCAGEVKGFIFRRIDSGDGPKYLAISGLDRKSVFFNMPAYRDHKGILVVEAEFDAITATHYGFSNLVAKGGADISGDRRHQVEDAFARGEDRNYLCPDLDADSDGNPDFEKRHAAIMRSIHTIKNLAQGFENIYVVCFPKVTDPDSFLQQEGPDRFNSLVKGAVPYWNYLAA